MWSLRAIFTLSLAVLWLSATNSCLIAAAFPELMESCCECTGEQDDRDGMPLRPIGPEHCEICAALESGVNPGVLVPLVAPAPAQSDATLVAIRMRPPSPAEVARLPRVAPNPTLIPSPAWREVMKKALPVRGPSLTA